MRESDEKIKEGLWQQLKDHPRLDTKHFTIEVEEGHVHLKGKADTEEEKVLAEKIASEYPGVSSVKNDLHLELGIIHAITSLVSGIAASNEEELHHKDPNKATEEQKNEDPD